MPVLPFKHVHRTKIYHSNFMTIFGLCSQKEARHLNPKDEPNIPTKKVSLIKKAKIKFDMKAK